MRLLLTGASGSLGSYILRECLRQGDTVIAWSGSRQGELFGCPLRPIDLAAPDAIASAFRDARPDGVVHTAALAVVSECHRDPQRAERINTRGSAILAELADRAKIPLIHVSTDMVFDGEHAPYREEDAVAPVSVYGRTKAEAERAVRAYPRNTVVRVPLLFGPTLTGRSSFFDQQLLALREGRRIPLFHDEWRTPLSLLVTARALLAIVSGTGGTGVSPIGPLGLLHIGGPERLSRLEMGQRLAAFLGCDASGIEPISRTSIAAAEPRQADLSLDSSRWRGLFPHQEWPDWNSALSQLMSS
ncbi:MAG TPA: SDR family oxidoreductase [Gemmataceae bacterium]|nr:SDR family oxidoreductase [Gemmataceae bacterium]